MNSLTSASCHRVTPIPFKLDQFDDFHNLPEKIQQREAMLRGEWPGMGCEYCRDIEHAGGFSDRMHNLDIPGLTPPELDTNPTATHVTPRIVEIFAQNTCNLACTYCNSGLSSKIEHENKKFGEFYKKGVGIPLVHNQPEAAEKYFLKFLDWLARNIQHLRRLHLLGGETFLQHKLMSSVLDIIEQHPSPDLELCVFSNLMVPDSIWKKYMGRIEDLQRRGHIKVFDLTASIDCWGPESEYARFGLKLDEFEQKFAWASEQGDWLRLNANQTVTALTMRTMADLIVKIADYSKSKHIGHYFQFYTGPHMFQHPRVYGYSFWEKDFDRIFKAMPDNDAHQHEAVVRMQGIQTYLQSFATNNLRDIGRLHTYLDELDRRRGTNWRDVFPYLEI